MHYMFITNRVSMEGNAIIAQLPARPPTQFTDLLDSQ